ETLLGLEQSRQALAHQVVVLREDEPNRHIGSQGTSSPCVRSAARPISRVTPLSDFEMEDTVPGPLPGVKIVELTGIGPGPVAAMLLSDMGAEVVKVDRAQWVGMPHSPGGVEVLDRGRRSIAVDLKQPEGVETVLRLVESADALIEGYRPGVAERLG